MYQAPTEASRRAKAKFNKKVGPSYFRNRHLIRKYGITLEDQRRMQEAQDHKCKICCEIITEKNLHVDHCHKTGRIRGLLCRRCNRAIGLLKDDPTVLYSAIGYLEAA